MWSKMKSPSAPCPINMAPSHEISRTSSPSFNLPNKIVSTITRWGWYKTAIRIRFRNGTFFHLCFQLGHQSYTVREIRSACIARSILKTIYPVIFHEYEVPKSSYTIALCKINRLLQSRNLNNMQKRVEVEGIPWVKVRDIVKFTVQLNKSG